MKFRSLGYCIGQGIKNIGRNRIFSLASIATMTLCIFLIGFFYSITSNVTYNVENMADRLYIQVFFDYGITDERIESIGNTIKEKDGIVSVHFTSAEEAWEEYKKKHFTGEYEELAEAYKDDNPLANSASYEIYFASADMQKELVEFVGSIDGVRQVNSHENSADGLTEIGKMVGFVSIIIIGLLIAVALFLITNTIANGIMVRKNEIEIMRFLGARNGFIRAPFIVEGLTIGILGTLIPIAIVYFSYDAVVVRALNKYSFISTILSFQPVLDIFKVYVPVALVLGVGLGLLGSIISLTKHLKV